LLAFPASAANPHDTLTIGISQFPNTFNPNTDSLAVKEYILAMARPDMTTFDKDWHLICYLCVALPSFADGTAHTETGPDGKPRIVETYALQPNATWDDGVPVTTKDILFSLEVGRYPKSGYSDVELYQGDAADTIDSIDAIDDKHFTIHRKGVPCDYQNINDFRILPAHVEQPVFEADPDMYRLHTRYDADPSQRGLYYGPYRISHVERGSSVELEPNPTWWGKKPAFAHIRVQAFENSATLQSALASGEIDYLPGEGGMPENVALTIGKHYPGRYNIVVVPTLADQHIDFDLAEPMFQDVRMRRALLLAVDRPTIDSAIFDGIYQLQTSFVAPRDPIYTDQVAQYGYDPAQAATLLDQAGWTPGSDGMRRNAVGEPLAFRISTTSGDRRREELEQALAWYWKQVGVEVRIMNQPARILFGQTLKHSQSWDTALYSWMMSPGGSPRGQYASAEIPTEANGYSGENFLHWNDPAMDHLIDAIETECAPDKNKEAWHAAQARYADQLPSLPLFYRASAFVMPKWLKGVEPTGHEYPSSMWVQDWYAEDGGK
jgi:peptide/nickel transport system substrate-binding protein